MVGHARSGALVVVGIISTPYRYQTKVVRRAGESRHYGYISHPQIIILYQYCTQYVRHCVCLLTGCHTDRLLILNLSGNHNTLLPPPFYPIYYDYNTLMKPGLYCKGNPAEAKSSLLVERTKTLYILLPLL